MSRVPIVIPSYEPDEKLLKLCRELTDSGIKDIIIVDDGSGKEYRHIFNEVYEKYNCVVLRHAVNLGKGRGLKTAFNYVLNCEDAVVGCVTADSDGQHLIADIQKCVDTLTNYPDKLVLGVRDFGMEHIPFKSKFGNTITQKICRFLCGINVTDTQTGLRGIPVAFMKHLMNVGGERFEFEMNMLIESRNLCDIEEVKIETVYESKTDHKTHFKPFLDSLRIYGILGRVFLKYILSSVSSFVLDIGLFALLCSLLKTDNSVYYVAVATVIARVISATYNYMVNYKIVFHSNEKHAKSMIKYFVLAVVQMCMSAMLVTGGTYIFTVITPTYIKVVVDSILFLLSYYFQRKFVY